jgi:hypothetical protein
MTAIMAIMSTKASNENGFNAGSVGKGVGSLG